MSVEGQGGLCQTRGGYDHFRQGKAYVWELCAAALLSVNQCQVFCSCFMTENKEV